MKNEITVKTKKNGIIEKIRKNAKLYAVQALSLCFLMSVFTVTAYADFDGVVNEIVNWVKRIGAVVGFIGGIQFALGYKNDDADAKTRGLMTLGAGFLVVALCTGYNTYFKV